jgi:hypothetical protein
MPAIEIARVRESPLRLSAFDMKASRVWCLRKAHGLGKLFGGAITRSAFRNERRLDRKLRRWCSVIARVAEFSRDTRVVQFSDTKRGRRPRDSITRRREIIRRVSFLPCFYPVYHVDLYIHIYAYIYIHTYTQICAYVCVYIIQCICGVVGTRSSQTIAKCTHTRIHTYTHAATPPPAPSSVYNVTYLCEFLSFY